MKQKKILWLSAAGGMLEFYDFTIYSFFLVYFNHQFFPAQNVFFAAMESYLVLVLGYFARPFGGILFSHLGDEYGRKPVLVMTSVLMGFSSLGIGLLPTYSQIDFWAPLLLIVFRFLQGLALGGELPSTYVFIYESIATQAHRNFAFIMIGVNSGALLGLGIHDLLTHLFTQAELDSFAWRIPFIFGGLICVVSYYIRKSLKETGAFQHIKHKVSFPLLVLFKEHFLKFLWNFGLITSMSTLMASCLIFMPFYLQRILGINPTIASRNMVYMMVVNVIAMFLIGRIADWIKPFRLFQYFLFSCFFWVPLIYFLFQHHNITMAIALLGILEGFAAVLTPLLITSHFPTAIRLTGVATSYNASFIIFGGLSPILLIFLIQKGANIYWLPSVYTLVMISISLLSTFLLSMNNKSGE